MLLIGLDAASDHRNFGYALGYYDRDSGIVRIENAGLVSSNSEPNALVAIIAPALKRATSAVVAIDAPLGWPVPLAKELIKHSAGQALLSEKESLFQRATDRHVRHLVGKTPLEVGADKIARAAHSALGALNCLRQKSGKSIPLAWSHGNVDAVVAIEVYPAATLMSRGLPDTKYKDPEQLVNRKKIVKGLDREARGMNRFVRDSDDVFDACLCLVAAKDFLDGKAVPPSEAQQNLARREGWIWVRSRAD